MPNRILKIERRTNYGAESWYPACDDSKIIAAIAGTKTMTQTTLRLCHQLGYDLHEVKQPSKLDGVLI